MTQKRMIKTALCLLGYVILITAFSFVTYKHVLLQVLTPLVAGVIYFSFCIVIDAVVAMYLEERRNRALKDLINKNYNKDERDII